MPYTVQVRNKGDFGWQNEATYPKREWAIERAQKVRQQTGRRTRIITHKNSRPTIGEM